LIAERVITKLNHQSYRENPRLRGCKLRLLLKHTQAIAKK
jgi:hypothetical protein